jgi:hypothetical protein
MAALRPKQTRLSHTFGGKLKFAAVTNLPAQISKSGHFILRSNSIYVAKLRWRDVVQTLVEALVVVVID